MVKLIMSLAALALLEVTLVAAYLPADYQTRSAAQKQTILWNQIILEPYSTLPTGGHGLLAMARLLAPTYHTTAFNRVSDELEDGRVKLLHPYGSCAKAELRINAASPYTGVLKANSVGTAVIRPSVAAWDEIGAGLKPGLGVKVLINGGPSVNFHTLFNTDGNGPNNNNFFLNPVANTFVQPDPSPATYLIVKAMELALKLLAGGAEARPVGVNLLGLTEQTAVEVDGTVVPVNAVRAPFKLTWIPNPAFQVAPESTLDFRRQIERVPSGSTVYTLTAFATQADADSNNGVPIGELVTTSEFVTTKYCDDNLYLQHARRPWRAFGQS
ncbi:hypothetical protein BV898_18007 [Hypsibius exemplaris]|uniref:Uncharacterized protein n=1 Tax=Hypsibius exemplaris TaxID=2072580 RepID=A0A9X6RN16_HYPEX|nr:hypothetical protein BV898_18007 [Hypsibius exemplaris]